MPIQKKCLIRDTGGPDVVDPLKLFFAEVCLLEVLFILGDLEGIEVGILVETCSPKPVELLWHEDTSYCNHVTRGAFSSNFTPCNYLQSPWYVANRHLITWLLELDLLVGHKLG